MVQPDQNACYVIGRQGPHGISWLCVFLFLSPSNELSLSGKKGQGPMNMHQTSMEHFKFITGHRLFCNFKYAIIRFVYRGGLILASVWIKIFHPRSDFNVIIYIYIYVLDFIIKNRFLKILWISSEKQTSRDASFASSLKQRLVPDDRPGSQIVLSHARNNTKSGKRLKSWAALM